MISQSILATRDQIQRQFQTAQPFRFTVLDNFLQVQHCEQLLADFPPFQDKFAINEHGHVGGKAVVEQVNEISPFYWDFYEYINSDEFLKAMSEMTGIPDLIADPTLFGGGTHDNRDGQGLDIHVDFNIDERRSLHRRLNLLIYLNKEWDPVWGGNIELHSDPKNPDKNEVFSSPPLFNRALIFETNERSWHGFGRIQLPGDKKHLSRKSFSIYLYTKDRPAEEIVAPHTTFYLPQPLPRHLVAGHTLSEHDAQNLHGLMASRDGLIQMYHKLLIEKEQRIRDAQVHLPNVAPTSDDKASGYTQLSPRAVRLAWNVQRTYHWLRRPRLAWQQHQAALAARSQLTTRECPACASSSTVAIGELDKTVGVQLARTRYVLANCRKCDLVFLSPEPSAGDLRAMYDDAVQFSDATYTDPERVEKIVDYMTHCFDSAMASMPQPDGPIRVLEIGAGLAWMCRAAKLRSATNVTVAQDVTREAVSDCNWVDHYVVEHDWERACTAQGPFNLISMTHVIEHLVNPLETLSRCKRMLAHGGRILITAPHRPLGWTKGSRNIQQWKTYTYNHVPAHIQYFSEAALRALADRAGLRLERWDARHENGQAFEAWLTSK